jgi:hypothetical protein
MVTFCWAAATLSSGAGAAGEAGGKCRFMLTGGGQRAVGQLREGGMRARSKFAFKSGVNYNRPGFTQRRVLQAAPSLKSTRESTHIIPNRGPPARGVCARCAHPPTYTGLPHTLDIDTRYRGELHTRRSIHQA